ncbi:putative secreted protein with PEP-CTERM sorting signal [Roseimicrobium gellanilyticum]|uniref:Putative secreted protein with PEP-CTERM sorting signal n=1 Tax=Roseimicrobium gellanilyticum TaxID=748857 RepID=A0A366HK25_9BACT|nr:autotransporter-associated beta strand repeat-containing protein [Roseimicrobium gellanilyticum]RBP42460.1 putative secreted protein with PEP-CTERM sorting signal [Roseimicrobium gellanilyticum]
MDFVRSLRFIASSSKRAAILILMIGLLSGGAFPVPALRAETFTWDETAASSTYNWNVNANWTGVVAGFPNAEGDVANVNIDIAGNQTIRLRQDITLGVLNLGDSNATTPSSINISNASGETFRLIFDNVDLLPAQLNTTGAGSPSNTIGALVELNSDLQVRLGGGDTLTMSGAITTNDNDITFSGGAAFVTGVTVNGNITGSGVITNNGAMSVSFGGTTPKSFTGTLVANRGIGGTNTGSFTLTNASMASASEFVINGWLTGLTQNGGSIHAGSGSPHAENPGQRLTTGTITMNGGSLRTVGQAAATTPADTPWRLGQELVTDNVSVLHFKSAYSQIGLSGATTTAGTRLNIATLQRSAGASAYITSGTLGGTARLTFANAASFLVGGGGAEGSTTMSIMPWMGAANINGSQQYASGFATHTATGVRALVDAEYANNYTSGPTTNVSLDNVTIAGATTINALRFTRFSASNITDNQTTGVGQTLTVTSGGVFFSNNGGTIGATGNVRAGTLNFGTAEGVVWANGTNTTPNTNTIGAVITGSNGMTKAGSGNLVLSGANTYTGNTYVGGGTLQVGIGGVGRTGAGDVIMNARGTTLAGTGTVQGSTTLTYGKLAPGDTAGSGVGTLTINGGLALTPLEDSQGPYVTVTELTILNGTTSDKVIVGQGLTLNAAARIVVTLDATYTATEGDTWDLLDWAGVLALNGFSTGENLRNGADDANTNLDLPTLGDGLQWSISNVSDGGSLRLTIQAVPEPSSALLLAVGLSALVLRRRRQ